VREGNQGSGPRRRTVLTSPEFEWVVGLLDFWLSVVGRARFPTADRSLSLRPTASAIASVADAYSRLTARSRGTW
jgi:integrase/recombinase XerD